MKVLFWSYGILLATGLVHAFLFDAMFGDVGRIDDAVRLRMYSEILVVEVIDTVVMLAVLSMRIPAPQRQPPTRHLRLASWLAAVPILGGMLSINYGYHWTLRHIVGLPLISDDLMSHISFLSVVLFCLQPAVVEEAYCRLFVLDRLSSVTSLHAAVWLSATMFAFLHVALLPSIPYLILLGAVLAYLRFSSGTLILPVLVHFVHNLIVMFISG